MSAPTVRKPTKRGEGASGATHAKAAQVVKEAAQAVAAEVAANAAVQDDAMQAKNKREKKADKKPKAVRGRFKMPEADYEKIAILKQKCREAGIVVKKSELLRVGLRVLDAMPDERLLAEIDALETNGKRRASKSL
jgi:hypothetical protein